MDGYYHNGGNFNYGGYAQRSSNFGYCSNCPSGKCPWVADRGQGQGQETASQQRSCPGGNCCRGGNCSIGRSGGSNLGWQN